LNIEGEGVLQTVFNNSLKANYLIGISERVTFNEVKDGGYQGAKCRSFYSFLCENGDFN
jgi:hypothetical protein